MKTIPTKSGATLTGNCYKTLAPWKIVHWHSRKCDHFVTTRLDLLWWRWQAARRGWRQTCICPNIKIKCSTTRLVAVSCKPDGSTGNMFMEQEVEHLQLFGLFLLLLLVELSSELKASIEPKEKRTKYSWCNKHKMQCITIVDSYLRS